ncbi:Amidase [Penicillium fimorum]|uniref:Amidase n=1 Tax=Penicillium fimorum TaxID=1882269 RepID=A0A9X0C7M0_9EURO|nr:Amidase [Penicillium fimorum]
MGTESWEVLVHRKQLKAAAKIPSKWRIPEELTKISETSGMNVLDVPRQSGVLSERQLVITENHDATDLLCKIHRQELSAYEVTEAFCIRAAIAQQVTRCLTEAFFERALQRAKDLDEILSKTGELVGPLYGLPISFKDCFNIIGVPSTIGFTSFIKNDPLSSTSPAVQVLLNLGTIQYVKTNVPQTIMAADSHNYVFGRTLNPH